MRWIVLKTGGIGSNILERPTIAERPVEVRLVEQADRSRRVLLLYLFLQAANQLGFKQTVSEESVGSCRGLSIAAQRNRSPRS